MSRHGARLTGLLLTIVALLVAIYAVTQHFASDRKASSGVGAGAAASLLASRLDDAKGGPQSFAQWRGKTLVVNFWATWCPPCREEMPAFSRLQRLHADKGVQFVGIALDSAESVRSFSESYPVSYPLLVGGARGVELAGLFGNTTLSLPYTVVLARDGAIRLRRLGLVSESELDRLLAELSAR